MNLQDGPLFLLYIEWCHEQKPAFGAETFANESFCNGQTQGGRVSGISKSSLKENFRGFRADCPTGELDKKKIQAMYRCILPAGNAKVQNLHHMYKSYLYIQKNPPCQQCQRNKNPGMESSKIVINMTPINIVDMFQ